MSKKICSLLVAVCMVLTMAVGVFAADTATFSVNAPAKAEAGEEITVTVTSSAMKECGVLQFNLNYDAAKVEYVSATSNALGSAGISAKDGYIVVAAGDGLSKEVAEGEVILEATFKVNETAEFSVSDAMAGYLDANYATVAIEVSTSSATVEVEAVEPECTHANTEVVNAKEATCCVDGYTGDTVCKDCGATVKTGEVIKANGEHTYGEGCVAVKPHEHVWTDVEGKAATCTEAGYTAHKVCECNEKEGYEVIPAKGHDWKVTTEATCCKAGVKTCSVCGETEEVKATGKHTYDENCDLEKPEKPVVTAKYYTVKAEAGLNGKISPEGTFEVKAGKDKTFKITANEGYVIDTLTVDRKEVAKAAGEETYTLTLKDIDENYTIKVSFVKEVVSVENDKANPSTGANDFVGAAVALAVVSVMGAAVISKK